jgi:hypothetical protein
VTRNTGAVRRRRMIGALVGMIALVWAPTARAQTDDGVTVDPGSPTGREYAIPLDSARRAADPAGGASGTASEGERGASPLFGAGIATTGSGGNATAGSGRGHGGGSADGDGSGRPRAASTASGRGRSREGPSPPVAVRVAASDPGAPAGGATTTALVIAAGVLVLAVGAGGGLLLRRRSRGR